MNQSDDTRHNGSSDGWESVTVKKRQPRVILQNCDNSHHAKSHFNTKSTRNSTHGPILPNRSQVGNVRLHDNMSTRVNYAKDAVYSKNRVVQSTFIPLSRENLKVACLVPSKSVCETETPSTLKISNIRTEIKPFIAAPTVIASEHITASNLPRRSTEGAYDLMMFLKTPKSNSKTQLKNVDNRKLDTNRPRFDINEEFKARRFVATKRKKKFTKMKKRILMERLRNFMKNQAVHAAVANAITPIAVATPASDGEQPSEESIKNSDYVTVFLLQFVTGEDISDPLEFQEVLNNIDELFSPFGDLCSIDIKLLSSLEKLLGARLQTMKSDEGLKNDTLSNDGADMCDLQAEVEEEFDAGEFVVIVTFRTSSAARSAVAAINGVVFGAQPIVAILGSMDGESSVLNIEQSNISSMQSAMNPIEGDNHKNHLYSSHQGDIVQPRSMNNQDIQTEVVEDGVEEEGYELCLENSIFPEDIEDEDERREVLEDLYCLCEVFGHISVLWIEKDNGTCARPNQSDDITNIKDACPEYWMTIEFEYADDAEHAVATLNGMCVGGEYVQAGLYSYAAYLAGEFIDDHFIRIDDMSSETRNIYQETARGTVVAVRNYISKDDIDECAGDSVELSAIKRDLLALSSSHVGGGDTKNIFVSRVAIVCGTGKSSFNEMERKSDDTEGRHCPMEINSLTACVRFSSLRSAVDAMLSLDGTALGGTLLRASVRRSHLCLDDIHSAESIGEEIESAVGEDGIKGNSAIQKKEIVAFKKVSKISHSSPIQTATVDSSTSITTISLDVTPQLSDIVALNRKKNKKDKTDPSVSIYKQAVLAPKLDKCTRPRQRIKVASEEVEVSIKEMLGAIATFQEKLKERDPLKAAAKRRFVMGVKQATNCIRSGLAKLILLAPDSESSEALDGLLDVLLGEAQSREIPVLYCLNRRKLGKAVKSSMKQVVIAVLDADGAYGWYKKIVAYVLLPEEDESKSEGNNLRQRRRLLSHLHDRVP